MAITLSNSTCTALDQNHLPSSLMFIRSWWDTRTRQTRWIALSLMVFIDGDGDERLIEAGGAYVLAITPRAVGLHVIEQGLPQVRKKWAPERISPHPIKRNRQQKKIKITKYFLFSYAEETVVEFNRVRLRALVADGSMFTIAVNYNFLCCSRTLTNRMKGIIILIFNHARHVSHSFDSTIGKPEYRYILLSCTALPSH